MTFEFPPRKIVVPVAVGGASVRALEWARLLKEQFGTAVRLHGSAAATILDEVKAHRPDMIVMGAERKSGALGVLFGNTTEIVMQLAEAPLLVVPTA
jgi:hypothetical protein